MILGQPGHKILKAPSQQAMWWSISVISAILEAYVGGLWSRLAGQKCDTLSEKQSKAKRAGGVA
jgi:hypothetical protein